MHRPALVGADGEQGLGDHGPQHGLGQGQGVLLVHLGQLGELLRVGGQDIELGQAALDVHVIAVGDEGDHVIGHFPHDLRKKPGGQHQRARLPDLSGDSGLDACLQIIAGQAQGGAGLDEDALQRGDGALGRHCPGGGGYRRGEQGLFTGKFHRGPPWVFLSQKEERKGYFFVKAVGAV